MNKNNSLGRFWAGGWGLREAVVGKCNDYRFTGLLTNFLNANYMQEMF